MVGQRGYEGLFIDSEVLIHSIVSCSQAICCSRLKSKRNYFMSNYKVIIKQLVVVITCLGGRFGINCLSAFLKTKRAVNQTRGY